MLPNFGQVFFRDGTSDAFLINKNLIANQPEYDFPLVLKPKHVLDIGANIGVTTLQLAKIYPDAIIHCFEPMKDNFTILEKNTQHLPNVRRYNFALGNEDGEFFLRYSDNVSNHGGASLYQSEGTREEGETVQVKNTFAFIMENFKGENPELIKIDCEGSESAILRSYPVSALQECYLILGELHGVDDFGLLNHLDNNGFLIGVNKGTHDRVYPFTAVKKA
jgi:FkbM family methyltransferase